MKGFRSLASLFLLLISSLSALGQSIIWQNTMGGTENERLATMEKAKDGMLLSIGYTMSNNSGDINTTQGSDDFWFVKVDPSTGAMVWQETFGGNFGDLGIAFHETEDGGYILGGYSSSSISGDKTESSRGGDDYWIIKLDANRNIEWEKTYGGNGIDRLSSIVQTEDGGYLLGGTSESDISGDKTGALSGRNDMWILKIDAFGNIEWQKTIGGNGIDQLAKIIKAVDGGYLLAGSSDSDISGDKTEANRGFGGDFWILKINDSGEIQWQKTIGGDNGDYLFSIHATSDGNYISVGTTSSEISGDKSEPTVCNSVDAWVVKLDVRGEIIWQKDLGGNSTEDGVEVKELPNGGFVVGAMSYSDASGHKSENSRGDRDYWAIELDGNGNVVNDKTLGGSETDQLTSLVIADDGKIILGGWSTSNISADKTENTNGGWDFWILKMQMVAHDENSGEEDNYETVFACESEDITLEGPAGISYSWSGPNDFSSTEKSPQIQNISSENEGVYNLVVEDEYHCSTNYIFEVVITEISNLNIRDKHECFNGMKGYAEFNLAAIANSIKGDREGLNISFYLDGIQIPESEYTPFTTSESTTLKVIVTSQGNLDCSSEYDLKLIVDRCHRELDIFPKYFTPNNDGYHDAWAIEEKNQAYLQMIYIYDRYGKLLKQLDTTNFWSWDGIYRGVEMPSDDYWFKAILKGENVMTGHFSLIR